MPGVMVWERSTSIGALRAHHAPQVLPRRPADPLDRLAHLVVRRGRARRDPDDGRAAQPAGLAALLLGADRLVADGAVLRLDPLGVLDVVGADALGVHQRGEVTGVARVVAAH